jgi:hypothetical protein
VVLNPATDDETVFIAAKQTFPSGPTVVLQTLPAQFVDGPPAGDASYTLTLPTGAPLVGAYSPLLPIAFTAQPGMAGQYTVQASANGYTAQSATKDISAADLVQNFALVP